MSGRIDRTWGFKEGEYDTQISDWWLVAIIKKKHIILEERGDV